MSTTKKNAQGQQSYLSHLQTSEGAKQEQELQYAVEDAKDQLSADIKATTRSLANKKRERIEMLQRPGIQFSALSKLDNEIAGLEAGMKLLESYDKELFSLYKHINNKPLLLYKAAAGVIHSHSHNNIKMVKQHTLKYPHNVTVIGKSTVHEQENMAFQTANAFQIWLEKNYVDNTDICLAIAMLHYPLGLWEDKAANYHISKTYQEVVDMIELWKDKTIEVICGM